jgi:hypothetical protein
MELRKLGPDDCNGKSCPAVYRTDRGSLVVQGSRVADAVSIDVPDSETLVEIPSDLLKKLVEAGELS